MRQQRILSACRLAYRQARVICGEAARIAEILPDRADRLKTRGEIRLARARILRWSLIEAGVFDVEIEDLEKELQRRKH
jgi:predicted HTH domain antitoxin